MAVCTELYVNPSNLVRVLQCVYPDGRKTVIKEIERPRGNSLTSLEADIPRSLSHRNICRIIGSSIVQKSSESFLCIEMEKGDTDLSQEIRRRGRQSWTEGEIWNMLGQTVAGFRHAQRQNVCHRDVKPHNLLLQSTGRVIITDFGTAKFCSLSCIAPHTLQGTVNYLSPELLHHYYRLIQSGCGGKPTHNPFKSDVYSLGLTFIEMIRGKFPLEMRNPNRIPEKTEEVLGELHCSEELKMILGAMVEPDSDFRPDFLQLAFQIEFVLSLNLDKIRLLPSNFLSEDRSPVTPYCPEFTISSLIRSTCDSCGMRLELSHLMLSCGHKLCLSIGCLDRLDASSTCPLCQERMGPTYIEICPECRNKPVMKQLSTCAHSFCQTCFCGWRRLPYEPRCSLCKHPLSPEDLQDLLQT